MAEEGRSASADVALLVAAQESNEKGVRELLAKKNVNVNAQDENGLTCLHWACRRCQPAIVSLLLHRKGIEPDVTDKYGFTPLHWSASMGDEESIAALLQVDVSLNCLDDEAGFTPLHWAVNKARLGVIPLLAQAGADVDMTCAKGLTPLQWAVRNGNVDVVKVLLDSGANPSKTDDFGCSPLHIAGSKAASAISALLIGKGADVNARGIKSTTPLIQAAASGDAPTVAALLAKGADVSLQNADGDTALHYACKNGFVEVVRLLMASRAPVNAVNGEGVPPLFFAAYRNHPAVIPLLTGANLLARNVKGSTALHVAVAKGNEEAAIALMDAGADLNAYNKDGDTAVHYATAPGKESLLVNIVKRGGKPNAPNYAGKTPIALCASRNNENLNSFLLLHCGPEGPVGPALSVPRADKGKERAPVHAAGPSGDGAQAAEVDSSWEIDYSELQLGKVIGKGSYGQVYRGVWRGTTVAIKQFTVRAMNEKNRALFHAEVDIMSKLRHPNIVLFMGACLKGPDPLAIVTEFVQGGSLFHALHDKRKNLTWANQLQICLDIASAMNYLHCSRPVIMHRDLKTLNILVGEEWQCKVCDFGLTKLKQQAWAQTRCGTPHYMAPQILTRDEYDEKADVYAFGIIMWEVITRKEPYGHLSAVEVGTNVLAGMRPVIPPSCPKKYAQLMQACWQEEAAPRPAFEAIIRVVTALQAMKT